MEKILSFQITLFGSFLYIKPDGEIAVKLLQSFQDLDFVPGTVNVSTVDTESKKIKRDSCLQMISQNKMWSIVFLERRININYEYKGGSTYFSDLDSMFFYAQTLLEKTFQVFPDATGNRLAVNGGFLLKNMNESERDQFIRRFSVPFKVYGNCQVKDWYLSFNALVKVPVAEGAVEDCNNIIGIGDAVVKNIQEKPFIDGMVVKIDINTNPDNTDFRFTYQNLMYFSESVKPLIKRILEEIEY